ncbi:response regulator [Rheinheimera tangshanensis]|uniref:Response regulator n=1 Tax=Rheinheimera tangshanensis TaxID=400153 RepID=A0A5C8M160_9GAMM|nr:response regulator [Rheinheimera tangshanensis]TXK81110.1 response regulator [Rheinheimera tangshanensis]GGM58170.1 response regulator [Rheinheimera tangshanensis]
MSLKLLIVDDSQVCLVLTRGYVQTFRADWVCTLAESAEQAMALIEKQAFDVYALDYNLPGRNGLELARWIRERDQQCFIGLLTSNIMNYVEDQAISDNIHYYRKPAKPDVIQQFVSDIEGSSLCI